MDMKTALKVIGGVLATLIAAIAIFYVGWLRPPSPDSVCENVVEVSKAELTSKGGEPSDAMVERLQTECIRAASTEPEFGRGPWVKRLKCMRDAPDYPALKECDSIRTL